MAELSEFFKSSRFNLDLGLQLTVDNVDAVMKGKLEHWILAYSRMDPINTKDLSSAHPNFVLKNADREIVYLTDDELKYLGECAQIVLAKKLFDMGGFSKIIKQVPYEPIHKYGEMLDKQEVFFELLEPLNEMEHQGNLGLHSRLKNHI